jgi:hypothetical protein
MNNFKNFDLIKNYLVNFKIYEEIVDNGDNIRIALSSEEDLWNNGENKNYKFFYRYILGRDEWVKNQNYQGDDYIKYQEDFLEGLKEFENITKASEIKSQVGLYLIGIALDSVN